MVKCRDCGSEFPSGDECPTCGWLFVPDCKFCESTMKTRDRFMICEDCGASYDPSDRQWHKRKQEDPFIIKKATIEVIKPDELKSGDRILYGNLSVEVGEQIQVDSPIPPHIRGILCWQWGNIPFDTRSGIMNFYRIIDDERVPLCKECYERVADGPLGLCGICYSPCPECGRSPGEDGKCPICEIYTHPALCPFCGAYAEGDCTCTDDEFDEEDED